MTHCLCYHLCRGEEGGDNSGVLRVGWKYCKIFKLEGPYILYILYVVVLLTKLCPTLATPWTVAHQALLSMGFPRQEYWSGLPFSSWPRDWTCVSCISYIGGGFFTTEPPGSPVIIHTQFKEKRTSSQMWSDLPEVLQLGEQCSGSGMLLFHFSRP